MKNNESTSRLYVLLKIFALLTLIGFVTTLISFFALGADPIRVAAIFNHDDEYEYFEEIVDDIDAIDDLLIAIKDKSIVFYKASDDKLKITYYAREEEDYVFSHENGVVSLINDKPFNEFSFQDLLIPKWTSIKTSTVSVFLPNEFYKNFDIKTTNGRIEISNFKLPSLKLESTNRRIKLKSIIANEISIKTTNAEISLENVSTQEAVDKPIDISLDTSNGKIDLEDVTAKSLKASTTNNKIEAESITCETIEFVTTNGAIEIEEISANNLTATTTNNRIEASKIDCITIDFSSTNGRITLGLSGKSDDYNYDLKSSSQDRISLNNSRHNGEHKSGHGAKTVKCKTTNGRIEITTSEHR